MEIKELGLDLRLALEDGPAPFDEFAEAVSRSDTEERRADRNFGELVRTTAAFKLGRSDEDGAAVWAALRKTSVQGLSFDDDAARTQGLSVWCDKHSRELPESSITDLQRTESISLSRAYGDLLTLKRIGATSAAKLLWAFVPSAAIPSDEVMRRALGFSGSSSGYFSYLRFAGEAIVNLARAGEVTPVELPSAVGRPETSSARLLDEFFYVIETGWAPA